jgi:putative membrane protein
MKETFKHYLIILLKGMGMGAADVVPGVSGGTIAFITGIYEELIHSIKSIDIEAVKLFFTGKWKSFWKHINGNFLLPLRKFWSICWKRKQFLYGPSSLD